LRLRSFTIVAALSQDNHSSLARSAGGAEIPEEGKGIGFQESGGRIIDLFPDTRILYFLFADSAPLRKIMVFIFFFFTERRKG